MNRSRSFSLDETGSRTHEIQCLQLESDRTVLNFNPLAPVGEISCFLTRSLLQAPSTRAVQLSSESNRIQLSPSIRLLNISIKLVCACLSRVNVAVCEFDTTTSSIIDRGGITSSDSMQCCRCTKSEYSTSSLNQSSSNRDSRYR